MNKTKASVRVAERKVTIVKKNSAKPRKIIPPQFDKEGFFLSWGIGIVVTGIGIVIMWATKTAPDVVSNSGAYSVTQRLARLMPGSVKETLAFILGGLFVLFGLFCLFLGIKIVFTYLKDKLL